ncbi:type VI secretion system Vgr family protein [Uliginosibacterium paludis]|uniref:Type VI secretion system tip protein TssI/VgrG n=1 Tax=Uliginosibacterium paludis TaxID=1615952 RepID=A0ABV2CPW5_9RHOO
METLFSGASLASGIGSLLPDRADFLKSLSQHARLVTLTSPLPDAALLVEQMKGREAVSEDFCFDIQCVSSSAHIELKSLIGEELTLRVLLADGRSTRSWHGVVMAASLLGSDGSLARYAIRIQSWTALMAMRRTSRIFQDKTVEDIAREVLAEYPTGRWKFELSEALQRVPLCIQYRETDREFLDRILSAEGLSYRFEHEQEAGPVEAGAHSRHGLVIFDAAAESPECRQTTIRFHGSSATESSDTIQSVQCEARVASTHYVRSSWDYRQLLAPGGSAATANAASGLPELEDYDALAAASFQDPAAAERFAELCARHAALSSAAFRIAGTVRQLEAGAAFTLTQHEAFSGEAARFKVLIVEHEASNNLDSGARDPGALLSQARLERGIYRNRAVCAAASVPLVPRPIAKPAAPGLQTALVVGPVEAGADLATASERNGRVRIQFHWQRGGRPNPGGLAHETERATGDNSNGIWVRVAEALAGPNWGSSFTPRVGSEVLVDFDAGDLDHPVIVGALYNGQDTPPWPAGEESAANHAGVVAGFHASTLDGSGWSQWQIDDASGQLRTRLASSAHASQLNLGYLIQHQPLGGQRGAWRGQGFELHTDGWQIQRAAKGMLLSATARQNGASTQLDTAEAAAQLKAAADTAQRLSDAAAQSEADALAQLAGVERFRDVIHPEAAPADGTGSPERELKSFSAPAMLAETPSSLVFATPASTTLFAGEQLAVVAQHDTQLSAQHTASLVSGEATSLYTHAGGIKAIAANAPLSIQAHDGPLEVLADQNVTITSSNDEIHVLANEKIVLQAGQSSITLEGANITFACPGKFEVKAAQKALMGGGCSAAELEILPAGSMGVAKLDPLGLPKFDQFFVLRWANSGKPVSNRRFKIRRQSGAIQTGSTDADGRSPVLDTATAEERLRVQVLRDDLA